MPDVRGSETNRLQGRLRNRPAIISAWALAALGVSGVASAGTIVGTKHDLSAQTWAGGEICVVCHTPHNAGSTEGPLWNHTITTATHTMYTSPSLDAASDGQVTGTSKLCLSCHDGTVAVDSFGGTAGGAYSLGNAFNLGTDLSNDHPISITYDSTLATVDAGLFDPATTEVTIGEGMHTKTGSISDVMLPGGKVQCASCHDVHNQFAVQNTKLLRVTNAGSGLCLTCHQK